MGFGELVLILLIVVVVFGSAKLPQAQDSLAQWLRGEQIRVVRRPDGRPHRWSKSDWILVATVWLLAATALWLMLRRHLTAG
jgi:hypothetical protein